jgi:hypothetical protein
VATRRVSVLNSSAQSCAFISDSGSNDIAAISIPSLALIGTFKGSKFDTNAQIGSVAGMGLANNGKFLYASFSASRTIATFEIQSGCALKFRKDVSASGLNGGRILDMAVHGNLMVASFNDGSIGSFSLSNGGPVSNHDLQFSTSNVQNGSLLGGVDLTADGRFGIFGNAFNPNVSASVEVSDISSGKLKPTVIYSNLGTGSDTTTIWLTPDESLLYIGNFQSTQVSASFFNPTTGAVSGGCTSSLLNGGNFAAGLATAVQQGNGSVLYVAEADPNIGIIDVSSSAGACSLTEAPTSPVFDSVTTLESIAAFPPRPF